MNGLEKSTAAQGTGNRFQFPQGQVRVRRIHVDHHVPQGLVGLQELGGDIDGVFRKHLVDGAQYAGHVLVDMQQPVRTGWLGSATSGKFTELVVVPLSE